MLATEDRDREAKSKATHTEENYTRLINNILRVVIFAEIATNSCSVRPWQEPLTVL